MNEVLGIVTTARLATEYNKAFVYLDIHLPLSGDNFSTYESMEKLSDWVRIFGIEQVSDLRGKPAKCEVGNSIGKLIELVKI